MKIVIDIPEKAYEAYKEWHKNKVATVEQSIIANGTPYEEIPQGTWIEDSYAGIHCSECDYFPLKDVVIKIYADGSRVKSGNWNLTPYCPNCGAKMTGGRE